METWKNTIDMVAGVATVVQQLTRTASNFMGGEQQNHHQNEVAGNQEGSTTDTWSNSFKMVATGVTAVQQLTKAASNLMGGDQQNRHQNEGAGNQEDSTILESYSQPNLDFYRNRIPSKPNGDYIENILNNWFGNYHRLKNHTGYMQWLFPNRDAGLNPQAFCLKSDEAQAIRSDPVLRGRVRRAFLMILDLYGMELNEYNEFQLKQSDPECLEHFKGHSVSHMWVSRILKALMDLGHKDLMLPWLKFLAVLIYEKNLLPYRFRSSFTDFWVKNLDIADQESFQAFY